MIVGLLIAFLARPISKPTADIKTAETLRWSSRGALKWGGITLLLGFPWALYEASIVVRLNSFDSFLTTVVSRIYLQLGLKLGLSLAFVGIILGGLQKTGHPSKWRPNEGMYLTLRTAGLVAAAAACAGTAALSAYAFVLSTTPLWIWDAIATLDFDEVLRQGPAMAFFCAWFAALWTGGVTLEKHYILRLLLARTNVTPFALRDFLDYCTRLTLLQRVGGGYAFVHGAIMKHISSEYDVSRVPE